MLEFRHITIGVMFSNHSLNKIYLKLFFLIIFLTPILIYPQARKSTIHGIITNKKTKKVVSNVNVYLAYTMLGSSTNDKGEYSITNIPSGRYTMVISHVGYEPLNIKIDINNVGSYRSSFKLVPKVYQLPEINVTVDDQEDREDNIEIFKDAFIGNSDFAELTYIENPIVLNFEWKDREHLFATADKPLIIVNTALGYKIEYTLMYFEYNPKYVKYSGFPKFNLLKTENKDSLLIWEKNRAKVYRGSLRQFLHLISKNYSDLYEESVDTTKGWQYFSKENIKPKPKKTDEDFLKKYGFDVYYKSTLEENFDYRPIVFGVNTYKYLSPSENPNELFIKFNNYFEIWYEDPADEDADVLTSWIKLEKDSVVIDRMGRYYETFGIKSYGDWANERIAETLPYEYVLPDSVFIK
ncbi:MAG: hypothetical protein COW08_01230 [Ignavibacteriales bacterium CG12_big_fil_rev_8_21_14_0_65_30_8]|nr:MAG: hypothetical protein COW08_01230 [Ignavibacteriales bacterium CG12_big_fil_rev_8_21_14_0_65_30_8]